MIEKAQIGEVVVPDKDGSAARSELPLVLDHLVQVFIRNIELRVRIISGRAAHLVDVFSKAPSDKRLDDEPESGMSSQRCIPLFCLPCLIFSLIPALLRDNFHPRVVHHRKGLILLGKLHLETLADQTKLQAIESSPVRYITRPSSQPCLPRSSFPLRQ